uniref:Retrotransposon gag domain-containing protein n=1 Tax=Fagus sylvatica TaxID=28930 RepID=A0A2N9GHZ9_FAGSY
MVRGWSVRFSFWSGQRSWSNLVTLVNLVEFGQSSPNSGKCIPEPHFEGFWAWWTLVGSETARSNLRSTFGKTWSDFGKMCPRPRFLRLFDVVGLRQIRSAGFGLSRFACRHPRKSRGKRFTQPTACQKRPGLYQLQEGQPSTFLDRPRTEPRQFQPLPIPVPQLYTLLVKKKMITPVGQRTRIGPQPKDYNKDLTCEYHQGEVGHTVENCRVLRHRIQDLLDQGVLKFRIEGVINAIGVEKSDEVDIASTKIPWEPLCHETKKQRLLTTPRAWEESTEVGVCRYRSGAQNHNLRSHEEIKKEIAKLMMGGLQEWKEVKEDFEEFCEKKKEELGKLTPATPPEMSKPDPVVIQYATKEKVMLQTASVSTVQSSEKVPSVVIQVPQPFPYHDNKRVPWNYGMKRGEAIEQDALPYISTGTVTRIRVSQESSTEVTNQLTFSDDELPPEGRGHVKALYISVKTNDRIVSRVLIDNGSALNVCPLSTLEKLDIDPTRVRVTSMVVRAFDGTRREVLGEIDLPVEPERYPSSLHQKMKLIIGSQLVTILAEEPISIYNDGEIPYIDGCASEEASFHSFEFVTVIHRVAAVEPRLSRAGIMVAREFVKVGFSAGARFRLCEPRKNRDCNLGGETKTDMDLEEETFDEDNGEEADLPDLLPHLMISRGLETLEFEMFCEHEDPESHLQRYREKMALHLENELLMISVFPESLSKQTAVAWFYQLRNLAGWDDLVRAFLDRYRHIPDLKEEHHHQAIITTATAEEEDAGPMVEGLSIHTIAEEEDSTTTPPTRHCQQGEEVKTWTCVPLLQRVSSSNE